MKGMRTKAVVITCRHEHCRAVFKSRAPFLPKQCPACQRVEHLEYVARYQKEHPKKRFGSSGEAALHAMPDHATTMRRDRYMNIGHLMDLSPEKLVKVLDSARDGQTTIVGVNK